jgi:ABC-type antimicrobial peptide transport system permease subunit
MNVYLTYLRRELSGRKKQTIIIAAGMALAIALVIIVTAVSSGVKNAQTQTLASVYGVGTDITVTKTQTAGSGTGGQQFAFGSGDGSSNGSTRSLSQDQLRAKIGTETYSSSSLDKVKKVSGVKAATATLTLEDTSFSGTIPDPSQQQSGTRPGSGSSSGSSGSSAFSVSSFTVTGLDPSANGVGPLTSTTVSSGRLLTAADNGKDVVVLDKSYAKTKSLKVGSTVAISGTDFTVVGIVASTSSSATTASDSYIPLDTAQSLSSLSDKVSTIYVSADSASNVTAVQKGIEKVLPSVTVSTQAELASSVSGSLSTASNLLTGLGTWLAALVLAAAFLIATLFTISGVSRRTREFGTLKAMGWRNGRIVRQVAGESLVQGLIGGVIGVGLGLLGILIINIISPTLSSSTTATQAAGQGFPGGGSGGPGAAIAQAATDVVLHAPVTVGIILVAVGLSILGGLLAGAIGGWRAARLRPAEALRSVA